MKPNIFDIGTKELHQDAFLVWMLNWANPENKEYEQLHLCAKEFIQQLIQKQNPDPIEIISRVEAGRQWGDKKSGTIDVWAKIYTPKDNFFIIIEDKIYANEQPGQLNSYKALAENFCLQNSFKLVCIFLKTGSVPVSSIISIEKKGFSFFSRKEFLRLLRKYENIDNDIFKDYLDRLSRIEESYLAFEKTPIGQWTDNCWIGFYQFLEEEIGLISWHYVNPPNGSGFWNAGLNWKDWDGFAVYMQIEQGKLCYKISTHPEDISVLEKFDRSEIRNRWSKLILSRATKLGLTDIKRPKWFGHGYYMTSAVVERESWLGKDEKMIEKAKVIAILKGYKEFLDNCLSNDLIG